MEINASESCFPWQLVFIVFDLQKRSKQRKANQDEMKGKYIPKYSINI